VHSFGWAGVPYIYSANYQSSVVFARSQVWIDTVGHGGLVGHIVWGCLGAVGARRRLTGKVRVDGISRRNRRGSRGSGGRR